jgi:hypothetical protein
VAFSQPGATVDDLILENDEITIRGSSRGQTIKDVLALTGQPYVEGEASTKPIPM